MNRRAREVILVVLVELAVRLIGLLQIGDEFPAVFVEEILDHGVVFGVVVRLGVVHVNLVLLQ